MSVYLGPLFFGIAVIGSVVRTVYLVGERGLSMSGLWFR